MKWALAEELSDWALVLARFDDHHDEDQRRNRQVDYYPRTICPREKTYRDKNNKGNCYHWKACPERKQLNSTIGSFVPMMSFSQALPESITGMVSKTMSDNYWMLKPQLWHQQAFSEAAWEDLSSPKLRCADQPEALHV